MPISRRRLATDERRISILQAGLQVFGKQAYEATSIDDIAREAGMSKGLLYHYFPGKEALFAAAYEYMAQRFIAAFDVQDCTHPPLALLDRALEAYLKYAQQHPGIVLMLLRPPGSGRREASSLNDQFNARLAALLATRLGIRAGDARRQLAIRAWLAFVDKAVLDWLTQRKPARTHIKAMALSVLHAALDLDTLDKGATP